MSYSQTSAPTREHNPESVLSIINRLDELFRQIETSTVSKAERVMDIVAGPVPTATTKAGLNEVPNSMLKTLSGLEARMVAYRDYMGNLLGRIEESIC